MLPVSGRWLLGNGFLLLAAGPWPFYLGNILLNCFNEAI
jgi:hypothetical protein